MGCGREGAMGAWVMSVLLLLSERSHQQKLTAAESSSPAHVQLSTSICQPDSSVRCDVHTSATEIHFSFVRSRHENLKMLIIPVSCQRMNFKSLHKTLDFFIIKIWH